MIAGAAVINGLSSAWNNQRDVSQTVTLGLSQFHTGDQDNVIADEAYLGGTIRFFNPQEGQKAIELIKKVSTATALAHDCTVEIKDSMNHLLQPNVNHPDLAKLAQDCLASLDPQAEAPGVKWYASETFARYAEVCPTMFALVGIKNEALGSGAAHHNSKFDLDEEALLPAAELMALFAYRFLMG